MRCKVDLTAFELNRTYYLLYHLLMGEVDLPSFQHVWIYYLFYHLSNIFSINKCYWCRMGVPPFTSPLGTGIPLRSRRSWIEGHRLTFKIR